MPRLWLRCGRALTIALVLLAGAWCAPPVPAASWTPLNSGTTDALRAVSAGVPTAVGQDDTLLTSADGQHWTAAQADLPQGTDLLAVSYANASDGWAVGTGGAITATTDGGDGWTSQVDTSSQTATARTLLQSDRVCAFAWGAWTCNWLQGVFFTDATHGVAVGTNQSILWTDDGGQSWTAVQGVAPGSSLQPGVPVYSLNGVFFTGALDGWAVGTLGTILETTDGGNSWSPETSPVTKALEGVAFAAGGRLGWAVGLGGTIIATTDGGASWQQQTSGTTSDLLAVAASGPNAGCPEACVLAVGAGGTVLYSDDGGSTWTAQASGVQTALRGVSFTSAATPEALVVGDAGVILEAGGLPQAVAVAPQDTALSPEAGPPGTVVSVSGQGFGASPGALLFTPPGGQAESAPGLEANWSDTSASAQVPSGLSPGSVSVAVYNGLDQMVGNGLPFTVTGPLARLAFSATPVAAGGSLGSGGSATVTLTAEDAAGTAIPGATVWLSLQAARPAQDLVAGATASAVGAGGTTTLLPTPQALTAGGDGTIRIDFTAPAGPTLTPVDTISAQNLAANPTLLATDTYTHVGGGTVALLTFTPGPVIAAPGTLAPGQTVPITLTASDAAGTPLADASVYLAFDGASSGAQVRVGAGSVALTGSPRLFLTGPRGTIGLEYQAGGTTNTGYGVLDTLEAYSSPAQAGGVSTAPVGDTDAYRQVNIPRLTALDPAQGPTAGGTVVTLDGSGLTGAYAVYFGEAEAQSFTVVSDGTISASAPPGTGTVRVWVSGPLGTSAAIPGDLFTYDPAPSVSSVTPASGPQAGGSELAVSGTGFVPGATALSLGGAAASALDVVSATYLVATTPAGSGSVAVTVTTPGGSGSAPERFAYLAPPTVASVTPSSGPATGGTAVTISGQALGGASSVTFGGIAAESFTAVSATRITAVAPPGSGTVDVVVTTPGGTSAAGVADQFTYRSQTVVRRLLPGWNTLSIPFPLRDPSLAAILSDGGASLSVAYAAQGGSWIQVTATNEAGILAQPMSGLYLDIGGSAPVLATLRPARAPNPPPTFRLTPGWNLIGPSALGGGQSYADLLAGVAPSAVPVLVDPNGTGATATDPGGDGTDRVLDGYAYWVWAATSAELLGRIPTGGAQP